jgi:hypothetical protein
MEDTRRKQIRSNGANWSWNDKELGRSKGNQQGAVYR